MKRLSLLLLAGLTLAACKKESADEPNPGTSTPFSNGAVLSDMASRVAQANYNDLAQRTTAMRDHVAAFIASGSDADLNACKQDWRDARQAWERSEGMLFGPVSTENIDPRIDTWPVNFVDLDAQLSSGNAFTQEYITSLEDALKGFHPIEYMLFGHDGVKTAAQFTAREREYLTALVNDVALLTAQLAGSWDPSVNGNYSNALINAGNGSAVYPTQRAAFEELVNAMAGICDEVANGKMTEPLLAQDPSLEESPFAQNSLIDFTNNIKGVENVYLGRYTTDGTGMENFVREHNLQLDNSIKQHIAAAISALDNITV
ncbi:MAG TPA: imelysin family protein, partial [Flavobacteriales bacterium]|nr:imelysin family protein [Flavobacteriales bacterium]